MFTENSLSKEYKIENRWRTNFQPKKPQKLKTAEVSGPNLLVLIKMSVTL